MLWIAAVSLAIPRIGQAQELRGSVRDAEGGGPIGDVLVRSDSTGAVTWTDSDGSFALSTVGSGRRTFTFQRFGYETTVVEVEIPLAAPLEVSLEPRPVELEGIEATVTSFEARYAESKARLDRRLARLPGDVSVADASRIRPYDELHRKDPWKFLWSVMRIGPRFEEGRVQVRGIHAVGGRVRTPEVYVDDKRTWLFEFVHTPLSRFCRIEFYTPMPRDWSYGQVPTQLRAYTCSFMAEVASGEREMRKYINFGDLIAGPGEP